MEIFNGVTNNPAADGNDGAGQDGQTDDPDMRAREQTAADDERPTKRTKPGDEPLEVMSPDELNLV